MRGNKSCSVVFVCLTDVPPSSISSACIPIALTYYHIADTFFLKHFLEYIQQTLLIESSQHNPALSTQSCPLHTILPSPHNPALSTQSCPLHTILPLLLLYSVAEYAADKDSSPVN
ncbi:hypothetical protein BsWGS_28736 [Bradybaena similaris]